MNNVVLFVLTVALFDVTFGIIHDGQCPPVSGQANFDVERYLGTWYEVTRYDNEVEGSVDCVTANYYRANDEGDDQFHFRNTGIILDIGLTFESTGVAEYADPDSREGRFIVTSDFGEIFDYYILETDYINYSLAYMCSNITSVSYEEVAWVLSREVAITIEVQALINDVIGRYLVESELRWTVQDPEQCLIIKK